MAFNEATIRDKLILNLEILETGLSFIEKEKYLPNTKGTRGFVDILAKDSSGRYVLIELKRSDAACREAIHEILKYVEGAKAALGVREDEIRLIVVSTEWHELLIPFSSFIQRVDISASGLVLSADNTGNPISAKPVQPVPTVQDRLFAPWHEINLYRDENSLQLGLKTYEESCRSKGIRDFVLLTLTPHPDHHKREIELTTHYLQQLTQQLGAQDKDATTTADEIGRRLPNFKFMIYFACLQLDTEYCREKILQIATSTEREEILDYSADMKDHELQGYFHEKLFELEPFPSRDSYEIGYPAKFGTKLLDTEKWNIEEVKRYGVISKNSLLLDETIISELRGEQGVTGQKYFKEINNAGPAQLRMACTDIKKCLKDNPQWSNQLTLAMNELDVPHTGINLRISIYNPSNILMHIYLSLTHEHGIGWLPMYGVLAESEGRSQYIFGTLSCTGIKPSIKNLLRERYDNDLFRMLQPLSWGGYNKDDAFITRDIGLSYDTFKITEDIGGRSYFKLTALGWEPCDELEGFDWIEKYISENEDFVRDVVDIFSSCWDGVLINYLPIEEFSFRT